MTDKPAPLTTGYDGPDDADDETPEPDTRDWKFEEITIGTSKEIILRVLLDNEPIGMLRVPNTDYLRFLRQRMET